MNEADKVKAAAQESARDAAPVIGAASILPLLGKQIPVSTQCVDSKSIITTQGDEPLSANAAMPIAPDRSKLSAYSRGTRQAILTGGKLNR